MFKVFGKKSSKDAIKEEQVLEFEKMTINTRDLPSELESISAKYKIDTKYLDLNILSYKLFYENAQDSKIVEISEINRDEALSKENLLNPDIRYFQEIRAEVFKREKKRVFPISISIGANRDFSLVRATIKPKEKVTFFEGLEGEIISEIERKKVKAGLLIGFCDEAMRSGISKLVSIIRVNKSISKSTSFNVCEGIKAVEHIETKLIKHFEKKESDENSSFVHGVSEGELVLELIKSKDGHIGRNCKGEALLIKSVELSDGIVEVNVSDDFEIKEDEKKILYYAKRNGYINVATGNKYEIRDEYVVNSVNVKSTGNINIQEDSDVKVTIKESDSMADAVGPGVEIDTNELNIAGSVANNAKIKAKIVQIKGQTHQSSHIVANEVQIHLHKGYAEGDEVEIDIVEGGVIVGDIVRVGQLSGGEIRAKEVYIKEVISNCKIFASHHIELDLIKGNGNIFTIDALAQRNFHQKYEELTKELKNLEFKVIKLPKELKHKKHRIHRESESVEEIKKTIAEMKKFGKTPLASLITKLKDHQELIKKYNSSLRELKDARMQIDSLHEELTELNTSVLNAKVINKAPWKEFNEVKFKLIEPPIEVSFLPKEGMDTRVLSLDSTEEGEYHISREG